MNANELMVGDWVRCTDPKPFRIEQIDGIEEQVYGDDGFFVDTADLQPISLTKEILEKNGFEKQDDGWYKITLEEENLIGVQPFENVNWIFGANVFPNIIEHLNILYVHELQHALRLCGVEKEIIL